MTEWTFLAADEQDTERLGEGLARALPAGSVVGLDGPLGAGKTRLVQGLATTLGARREDVVSPTFVIIHEYAAEKPVYHFDAYRIADDDEFLELGPDEYFASPGITLVEWAERVERCLPRERLAVRVEVADTTSRRFTLTAFGPGYQSVLDSLAADLDGRAA
ncbi:MAG: tRNA (adenosine(37)-N6)-threonylcarbamoyltransferase complex ATPase subunit type 1 TsaE [Planctomycetota bacterium]|nr:MAG: tRNA (adenosine(37)-N6)-threonylcarbamoyltransferase complex ATPase subunit type 1 TsaE [Planctomycetota bacterium]